MTFVDTNVILRYILRDNEEMFSQAEQVISQGAKTTFEVLEEAVHVMETVYRMSREDISWYIERLLFDVRVDNPQAMLYAMGIYNQTNLDFIDCLLIAYKQVFGINIFSFDKQMNKCLDKEFMIFQR